MSSDDEKNTAKGEGNLDGESVNDLSTVSSSSEAGPERADQADHQEAQPSAFDSAENMVRDDDASTESVQRRPSLCRPALWLAEYESPEALMHAAESVRDAGYEKWDCHTPYPVHGMDEAMGLRPTKIGVISFLASMLGVGSAVLMMYWMNAVDYPIIVGGKEPGALPSMGPIVFELGILFTGLATVFGLFHICRLPRHHHPVFYSDRFASASDDRFFISIEAADKQFDVVKTRSLLEGTRPSFVELVEEEVL
ncbi:MAG: DUF3341 domain-containing protein [Myxococcota bacterium]